MNSHSYKTVENLPIPQEVQDAVQDIITIRSYRRGATISYSESLRKQLVYVLSGCVRILYIAHGKEHTYWFAFDNEMVPIPKPLRASAIFVPSIECLENTTLALIPAEGLREIMLAQKPRITDERLEHIFHGIMSHTEALSERILMLQTLSAPDRYRWLEEKHPRIIERANLTQIASFLGITKETLYRIRSGKYKAASPLKESRSDKSHTKGCDETPNDRI